MITIIFQLYFLWSRMVSGATSGATS